MSIGSETPPKTTWMSNGVSSTCLDKQVNRRAAEYAEEAQRKINAKNKQDKQDRKRQDKQDIKTQRAQENNRMIGWSGCW